MAKVRFIERTLRGSGSDIDLDDLKRKSWSGIASQFVRFRLPSEFDFRLANSTNVLVLLNVCRVDGEAAIAGVARSHKKDLRNKITFVPKGAELQGWARIEKPSSLIGVYFEGPADQTNLSQIPPMMEFEDHMLRAVIMQIHAILHDPSLDTPGYAETLGALLAFEMGRFATQSKTVKPLPGGLTQRQLRLVTEYLESRLTDKTTIAELSALVDLSRFHFIRAFKKTVGMPPHQFVVHRRIERARELLTEPALSVSEIATRTGFNSTTHFTKSFRRITGTTPSTFRREVQ